MKLLPAAAYERGRLLLLLGALAIAAIVYWQWPGDAVLVVPTATGPPPASNPAGGQTGPAAGLRPGSRASVATGGSQTPEPLRLAQIEEIPDEPEAGRNLFRFGVRPAPPPPPRVTLPPPLPPPMPTGPPAVPLKLTGLMADPYGRARAYLKDASGAVFEAIEGQIVDGRYRLLKIGTLSVVVSYLDGTGQRTIILGG